MGATVAWIGGLFFQSTLLFPAMLRELEADAVARLAQRMQRRFSPLAWLCLALLIATGLTQMAAHPAYQGILRLGNTWSLAILAKHLAVGLMLLLAAYQTWFLQPQLEHAALRSAGEEQASLTLATQRLLLANFILGLLVLGITAIARTA